MKHADRSQLTLVHDEAQRLVIVVLTARYGLYLEKILHELPASVSSVWWLVVGGGGAYLGAVSWVVYNSCLGFLGGGRRHFTMQGEDGWGGGHQGKCQGIPTYSMTTNIQHRRMCAHQNKAQRLWSVYGDQRYDCKCQDAQCQSVPLLRPMANGMRIL